MNSIPKNSQQQTSPESRLNDPRLYSITEVAQLLSIGRSTVYDLVRSGELPSVRLGRSVRVTAEALRDLIERNRADSQGER